MKYLKQQTIREYLTESNLLLEADEILGLNEPIKAYYGINVTKTNNEPIEQILGLAWLKRIQEYNWIKFNIEIEQIIFIGGLFEILNSNDLSELGIIVKVNLIKERVKVCLLKKIAKQFNLQVKFLTTLDLWSDEKYWEIFYKLFTDQVFSRGELINDSLKFYNSKDELFKTLKVKQIPNKYINLPLEVLKKIGNWPASICYTPAEVSEGLFLKEKYSVNAKIGQLQERSYDKYFKGILNTYRSIQPVDLLSKRNKVQIVTPYIDKNKDKLQNRIYFNDNLDDLKQKIKKVEVENYIYTTDEKYSEVLNPIIEKLLLVFESANASEKLPIIINNYELFDSAELLNLVDAGKIKIEDLQKILPELINKYIIKLVK